MAIRAMDHGYEYGEPRDSAVCGGSRAALLEPDNCGPERGRPQRLKLILAASSLAKTACEVGTRSCGEQGLILPVVPTLITYCTSQHPLRLRGSFCNSPNHVGDNNLGALFSVQQRYAPNGNLFPEAARAIDSTNGGSWSSGDARAPTRFSSDTGDTSLWLNF